MTVIAIILVSSVATALAHRLLSRRFDDVDSYHDRAYQAPPIIGGGGWPNAH